MLVAIAVNALEFFAFFKKDRSLGFIARLQETERSALRGVEIKPFDVMVFRHRVQDGPDNRGHEVSFLGDDGDVLLGRGLGSPALSSIIGSPQQTGFGPTSLSLATIAPQCKQR